MAMNSCPPGQSLATQLLKQPANKAGVNAVHPIAQPACTRNAMVELGELPQEIEMMPAPLDDVLEIVAGGDRGAGHQQQNLLDRIKNAPGLPVVVEPGKVLQKNGQTRSGA